MPGSSNLSKQRGASPQAELRQHLAQSESPATSGGGGPASASPAPSRDTRTYHPTLMEHESSCCSGWRCWRKVLSIWSDEPPSPRATQLEAHYQAPVVTPPQSLRIPEEDLEQRRLLAAGVPGSTGGTSEPHLPGPSLDVAGPLGTAHSNSDQHQKGHRRTHSGADSSRQLQARSIPHPKHRKGPSFTAAELATKAGLSYDTAVPSLQQEEDDSNYCPTCLEPYTEDNPKTHTACGHHYHLPCLYEWLERKETCPMCDAPLVFPGM